MLVQPTGFLRVNPYSSPVISVTSKDVSSIGPLLFNSSTGDSAANSYSIDAIS